MNVNSLRVVFGGEELKPCGGTELLQDTLLTFHFSHQADAEFNLAATEWFPEETEDIKRKHVYTDAPGPVEAATHTQLQIN